MAQNIALLLVTNLDGRDGHKMESLHLNFAGIHKIASDKESEGAEFPWILSIDEYGHTYINHYQATYLVKEIKKLELSPEEQAEAQKIIAALEKLSGEQLIYFAGD